MRRTREAEPAHRLRTLLTGLAAMPPEATAERRSLTGRFIVAPDASVELNADDRHVMDVVTRALPYRREFPGQSRWKVVVRHGFDAMRHAPYAFADARSVPVSQSTGPSLAARVLPSGDGGLACWIDEHSTLLHAQPHAATLQAYCASAEAGSYWAMRLVRDAMLAQLQCDGATVWARAAACVVGGAGLLIAGSPATGKTATLLACLQLLGGDIVADDRVLLCHLPDGLVGYPWPAPLTLHPDLVRAYPGLRQRLGAPDERPGLTTPVVVTQRSIDSLLGERASRVDHVRPVLMLWPQPQLGSTSAASPRFIHPGSVAGVLETSRFFARDADVDPPAADMFPGAAPSPPRPPSTITHVARLLARVPTFRISVTQDPHELALHITNLLREVQHPDDP